jgi:putative ABC transport system permease protein
VRSKHNFNLTHFLRVLTLFPQVLGLWKLALQRLAHEPGLTLALLAGWLAAVALVAAIPMYTDAINQALLRKELNAETTAHRPAFGFLFHYTKSSREQPWENYLALNQYVMTRLPAELGLPLERAMHYGKSDLFQFFPALAGSYDRGNEPLSRVHLGFITGGDDQHQLLEGQAPAMTWVPGEPLEVLVSAVFAEAMGVQVGEVYVLFNSAGVAGATTSFSEPVRIAGIWSAVDPTDSFWYIPPSAFDTTLLVAPETYTTLLRESIPRPLYDLGWYLRFEGGRVRAENVTPFLERIAAVETRVAALLPGARLTLAPVAALQRYQRTVSAQAVLILLLGLPVIGLVLLFVALIANSMIERQQLEIAILKSRGSSNGQIGVLFFLQGITLAVLALVLGLPLGWLAAQGMGSTRQFLTFARTAPISVAITNESIRFALLAGLLALIVTVAPAIRAAQRTIVTAKQQGSRARSIHWALMGGDLLVLVAAGYGYYLLTSQGSFAQLIVGQAVDPWQNPLLFVAPSLFLLAGARLFVHTLPLLLLLLEWLAAGLPGVTALLTLRNLARTHHHFRTLITLLLLTAGLGTYVTSFARTADENLIARTYYRIGAPVALVEGAGVIDRGGIAIAQTDSATATTAAINVETGLPSWAILPVDEHLQVDGVLAAARVGRYQASVRTAETVINGELYGIDREDFPSVAYFRRDFAPLSLGALMNELALEPAGILVSRRFLTRTTLQIGDTMQVTGLIAGTNQPLTFKIVGVLDLFPTAYPDEQEFFVANLEYIFNELGGPIPYYVWLAVEQGVPVAHLQQGLEQIGFQVLDVEDVHTAVATEQARPERVGLFGFFSLGFLITTLLSVLALITHAALMYQRQFVQLGILRAIGLSARQMATAQAGEHLLTTVLGICGGALLGLACSNLFIPFMQIGYTNFDRVPPFVIVIAWWDVLLAVTLLLGASLLVAGAMAWLLARLRMFNAIKLGETVQ